MPAAGAGLGGDGLGGDGLGGLGGLDVLPPPLLPGGRMRTSAQLLNCGHDAGAGHEGWGGEGGQTEELASSECAGGVCQWLHTMIHDPQ